MLPVLAAAFAVAGCGGSGKTTTAAAANALTKTQYLAMLKNASARVAKVETAAEQGLTPRATPAQVRALILSWGNTESALGRSFSAVRPPAGAAAANALLARGETMFGSELAYAANHLPKKTAAIGAYLQQRLGNAKGGALIDQALKRLKAAGY